MTMDRRRFLSTTTASLAAALAADTPKRVGLIGCGWYGKCDLFRLIQVAPVEVVSLCDVDKTMLAEAAELMSARQASKKTPRTYADYRQMLKEKDLDIVLVATPDHWHALAMIAAVQAGADVYVQKPISVDIVEAQAMLAAARKHKRVVQVGMQRRSTPHLIEAREDIVAAGSSGRSLTSTSVVTPARAVGIRRISSHPRTSITRCGRVPLPCAPTTRSCIPDSGAPSWSTATESWVTWLSTCTTWFAG